MAFIKELERKIDGFFQENRDILSPLQIDEKGLKDFSEDEILRNLRESVKEKTAVNKETACVLSIIEEDLPKLAPGGKILYKNEYIEKAIIILSRFHRDKTVYSLCINYLGFALPVKVMKKYSLLLCP